MGLLDILQGMSNGPRGAGAQSGKSGISPLAMGLLALLAYKTMKGQGPLAGLFGNPAAPGVAPGTAPGQADPDGGGLMSWLQTGLGAFRRSRGNRNQRRPQ